MRKSFHKILMTGLIFAVLGLLITQRSWSQWGQQFCPYCGPSMGGGIGYIGMPSFFPVNYPWWGRYGGMTYPNFHYPGAWYGNGIWGGMYPGDGRVYAAKPNVYVRGAEGQSFQIKVKLANPSHWLIAVPPHPSDKGWQGKALPGGKIQHQAATYDFLYYDYRSDEKLMQEHTGFCTQRETLVPEMADILKELGFETNEVADFTNHWNFKIPPMPRFCVYPQTAMTLDKVAQLEIFPAPKEVTRVLFVVVPESALGDKSRHFVRTPSSAWKIKGAVQRPPKDQESTLVVREWGVGFLQGDK